MDSRYIPQDHEQNIYTLWESAEAFNPDSEVQIAARGRAEAAAKDRAPRAAKPFSILLPPPNANDPLHIGHAMYVIEDVMIRYHRMLGDDTLWLPGTDHAGIETQFVYEKKLQKQDKSRFDFDRQTLYNQIWDYVQENSTIASNQLKRLGFSLDWSRFTFMLDEDVVKIVTDTFQQLYQDELVYRDVQLVNYCTRCGTSFSELEVVHKDQQSPLYYMKYGPFTLATTRPETKFGDTAVAVHPDDKRYQQYIGQEIEVEGLNGTFKLKVIADEYVDPEFGTGVVKITPAHDFNDFEVWKRHQDEIPGLKLAINFNGKLTDLTGKYAGLSVKKAREAVVADMQAKGLIEKIDQNYTNRVGTCYRCGTTIEPLPLPQFFVRVKPLVEKVLAALDNGEFIIHGAGHDKILRHWLTNLHDWNISRQIVWGIRMPVWYSVKDNPTIRVSFISKTGTRKEGTLEEILDVYKGTFSLSEVQQGLQSLHAPIESTFIISSTPPQGEYLQETDTFDTWFSSAQWPYTTLMTSNSGDFERFYPTSVMETGYDILPFWVMRMLLMGVYKTNTVPFTNVYLHGLIRDDKGRKMSKSKGNVINPLDVIDQVGADALRMALVIRSSAGLDKSVGHQDFKAMRNLTNKIWNAARFIMLLSRENGSEAELTTTASLRRSAPAEPAAGRRSPDLYDQEFSQHLQGMTETVTQQLGDFKIGLAAETLYNEFWHWFCDECIEKTKRGELSQQALFEGLITFLKLLHPYMPFITETIWQALQEEKLLDIDGHINHNLLIVSHWPSSVDY